MVETSISKNSDSAVIVLQPNNSSSWQFNLKIVASLATIMFFISTYFAFQGLWLIFPFSVLFIGILFVSLYLRLRANIKTEVITFDETTVIIERGYDHAEHTWKYHRLWAKIFVKKPKIRGYPKQIFIRSHGKEIELGSFLNKKDKERLIKDLKNIIYA